MSRFVKLLCIALPLLGAAAKPGEEALFAVSSGDMEQVRKILSEDPKAMEQKNETGETLLHVSAISESNGIDMVKLLVEKGADVNLATTGKYNRTPLHWWLYSASSERDEVVEYLLEQGADVQAKAEDGTGVFDMIEGLVQDDEDAPLRKLLQKYHDKATNEGEL